jgi:ABC-type uncharacterized transport system involved in gliding motility auxiliary subunit
MKKLLTTTGLIVAVIAFLALNIVANGLFKSSRLDLTDGELYTLSQGTKNILQNLQEPVTLRFYLSQKLLTQLPTVNTYANRVKELLQEYERLAGGKLNLHIIEPEPFSEAEDQAVGLGLQGVPLDTSNTTFYFGLAGSNSTDDEEVISFFQPNREEFLEYDVTKLVYQLSNPKQNVVGILSTLPIQGSGGMAFMQKNAQQAWMAIEQLRQNFEVRSIETDATNIDADIDVLMIVHPKGFSDSLLYAIDQYVLNGGRAIVFADPYSEAYEPPTDPKNPLSAMNAPRDSELKKLFDAWGVELVKGKVVGDLTKAKKVQARSGQKMVVVNYPVWMDLSTDNLSQEDIITGKLDDITVATAGILKPKEGAATTFTPLIQSGEQAMQIDTSKLGMFSNPEELIRDFKPGGEKLTIAARVSGTLQTAFPDGKPESEDADQEAEDTAEAEEPPAAHLAESKEAANIIIVADTDLLEDQFWVQVQNFFGQRIAIPNAANGTLLSNALENLSGSNDLISVRNRGSFSRPFNKVEELQQAAEQRFREKEQALTAKLKETEQKIRDLQNQKPQGGGELILSAEQQQALAGFRDEQVKVRKELRAVQHELRKDIERLESRMKFINIGLMPLLVGFAGIGLSVYSARRRRGLKVAK